MAAAVPATVAMTAASTETSTVVWRASMICEFWNRRTYHWREKPPQVVRLLRALKENAISTKMGA